MNANRYLSALALVGWATMASPAPAATLRLHDLGMPPGFHIALYADGMDGARQLALGANGTVFVGSNDGKVYAVSDSDHAGGTPQVRTLVSGLKLPTGVTFHEGDLYIGALDRMVALRSIEQHLDAPPKPELVTDKLPDNAWHGRRFIGFGPDGRLYVAVGSPCNVCLPDRQFGKILSMHADGSDWRDVASGIRNSVGFDWQPRSNELWFTDNGRDLLGDDVPSDELNRITHAGENFGFPWCHQGDLPDPQFGQGKSCAAFTPPVLKVGAHVAALGMRFYTGSMFPADYRGAAIIAEHGSWNRSKKSGYRVMAVRLQGHRVVAYTPLIDGFQHNEVAHGRPVDVLVMPDGAVLVSDDLNGAIYRVSYQALPAR